MNLFMIIEYLNYYSRLQPKPLLQHGTGKMIKSNGGEASIHYEGRISQFFHPVEN